MLKVTQGAAALGLKNLDPDFFPAVSPEDCVPDILKEGKNLESAVHWGLWGNTVGKTPLKFILKFPPVT